jgi:predicted phosphoribosyltransferase
LQDPGPLHRRARGYGGQRAPPQINGKTVILVDDGLATGATMRAAARALRQMRPSRLIIAVPVGAPDTCADLQAEVDEVVCLVTPEPFQAVGLWYQDFSQTTDREVAELLERANRPREQSPASSGIGGSHRGSR